MYTFRYNPIFLRPIVTCLLPTGPLNSPKRDFPARPRSHRRDSIGNPTDAKLGRAGSIGFTIDRLINLDSSCLSSRTMLDPYHVSYEKLKLHWSFPLGPFSQHPRCSSQVLFLIQVRHHGLDSRDSSTSPRAPPMLQP